MTSRQVDGADVTGRLEPVWYRDNGWLLALQCCMTSFSGGRGRCVPCCRKVCCLMPARAMRCLSRWPARRTRREIHLSLRRRRRETPLGSFRLDEAGRRAATAAICQRAGRVILRPDPAAVLERKVTLPLAAEHDVSRVLRYEMDRLTPFTAEQVFWSAIIERRDRPAGRLEICLSLLPKSLVQPVLAAIEAIGLKVSAIETASHTGVPRLIDLVPPSSRRRTHARHRLGSVRGAGAGRTRNPVCRAVAGTSRGRGTNRGPAAANCSRSRRCVGASRPGLPETT